MQKYTTIGVEFSLPRKQPRYFKFALTGKGIPQQAVVAQVVPGRLRSLIFLTFGTTRVVGRQPYEPAAFNTTEIPGTHF